MESTPARMTLTWSVPPGQLRAIAAALQALMVAARADPGCAGCSLSTDMGTRAVVHYVEAWKAEEDLKSQLKSGRFAMLAELMEHATEQPTIQFEVRGVTYGAEYAEKIRLE